MSLGWPPHNKDFFLHSLTVLCCSLGVDLFIAVFLSLYKSVAPAKRYMYVATDEYSREADSSCGKCIGDDVHNNRLRPSSPANPATDKPSIGRIHHCLLSIYRGGGGGIMTLVNIIINVAVSIGF